MKYIIIIAIVSILSSISLVSEMSKPSVQASIPVEYIDFTSSPMIFEVVDMPDPATLFLPSDVSDAGVDTGFIACP